MEEKFFLFMSWIFTIICFISINWLAAAFSIAASVTIMVKNRNEVINMITSWMHIVENWLRSKLK